MSSKNNYKRIFWKKSKDFEIRCAEYYLLNNKVPKGDILIIPGLSEFIERYDFIADRLVSDNYRVAILDLPGQGLSTRFGKPKTVIHIKKFKLYLDSISLLINELEFGKNSPLIFLGHSLGGFLSLYYQIFYRVNFNKNIIQPKIIILMAPMMGLPISKILAYIIILISKILSFFRLSNIGVSNILASLASFMGIAGSKVKESVSKSSDYWKNDENIKYFGKKTSENALKAYEENYLFETKGPSWHWLYSAIYACDFFFQNIVKFKIDIPILILNAEDESVTDPLAQKKLVKVLKNSQEVVLPSCRHDIIHEKHEVKNIFWDSIDVFLKKNLS